jgi:DNA-binding cell septation regulator SpoVG
MKITATWFPGKYPSFNLGLHTTEDSEEFLSIKGCRIVEGDKGPFVAYPYSKKPDGNYWRHAWGSNAFNEAVLKIALKDRPSPEQRPKSKTGSDDLESDAPF